MFADAYIEIVWVGNRPVAMYNQNSPTTTPIADKHGNVTGYVQITDYVDRVEFEPREIIHVSLDSARPGIFAVSPMQAALGPITARLFAAATGKETFKKGQRPEIHVDFPTGTQDPDIREWRDRHMTQNIGSKNIGALITTKGGANVKELQASRIDPVFKNKDQCHMPGWPGEPEPQLATDLLRAPPLGQQLGDQLPQLVVGLDAPPVIASTICGPPVGLERLVSPVFRRVAAQLPRDGRWCPTQLVSDFRMLRPAWRGSAISIRSSCDTNRLLITSTASRSSGG